MGDFLSRFKAFYAKPYQADMSAGGWFLMVGFLLVCAMAWALMLNNFKRAVEI